MNGSRSLSNRTGPRCAKDNMSSLSCHLTRSLTHPCGSTDAQLTLHDVADDPSASGGPSTRTDSNGPVPTPNLASTGSANRRSVSIRSNDRTSAVASNTNSSGKKRSATVVMLSLRYIRSRVTVGRATKLPPSTVTVDSTAITDGPNGYVLPSSALTEDVSPVYPI